MSSSNHRYYVTDSDLSDRFPIYTRANVGEALPGYRTKTSHNM